MAKDREVITVHTMKPLHRRGPVFYASLPRDTETPKGHRANGEEAKRRLVSLLWDHLVALDSLPRAHREIVAQPPSAVSPSTLNSPIRVVHDPLGRPQLLLGAHRGPAISFSEGGGNVWAALCGDESDIGIDVAEAGEFQGGYPFHRVFHAQELQHIMNLTDGNVEKASALLWSVKEAVVKALGCAFHLVDPLQIHIDPAIGGDEGGGDDGYTFPVRLSGKALARFPSDGGGSLWVRSFPQAKMCLSIAVQRENPA